MGCGTAGCSSDLVRTSFLGETGTDAGERPGNRRWRPPALPGWFQESIRTRAGLHRGRGGAVRTRPLVAARAGFGRIRAALKQICPKFKILVYRAPIWEQRTYPSTHLRATLHVSVQFLVEGIAMFVISHESALEAYRLRKPLNVALHHLRGGDLAGAPGEITVPSSSQAEVLAERLGLSLPLHVLAPHDTKRVRTSVVHAHAWSAPIQEDALLYLEDGLYLSAPAFLFQQLSARSDFENRLMLGFELVGKHAISPDGRSGVLQRPPLVTKSDLIAFLDNAPTSPGRKLACETAPYLMESARSPKEAEIAALYALPRRLGGRQIPGVELDHKVALSPEAQRIARRQHLYFDHYFSVEGRDHEYDSDDIHLTRTRHESDVRRENALKLMGIKLTVMTNGQLHDWETFDALAQHLSYGSGAMFRYTSSAIAAKQHDLWERLLFGRRVHGRTVLDARGRGTGQSPRN